MNISILEKNLTEIKVIRSLWEKLNLIHLEKSVYFKEKYENFTFEKRIDSIYKKAEKGIIKTDVLWDDDKDKYVGYCLSSIENNLGEIESIFIEKEYRRLGMGDKLMENALKWFKANKINNIEINVVYSNDEALPFYKKHGFDIGNYILKPTYNNK